MMSFFDDLKTIVYKAKSDKNNDMTLNNLLSDNFHLFRQDNIYW